MNHKEEGWLCTDPDQFQFCKKIDEDTFKYRQFDWMSRFSGIKEAETESDFTLAQAENEGEDAWNEIIIDIRDYSDDKIKTHISAYYDSLEQIKENYGNDWKMIVAECIFEESIY